MRKGNNEEEKQYQTQLAQEKELLSLTRQYFILDKGCSRSQFTKDSTLLRGEKVLNVYQKEQANILLDLQRAAAPGIIREDEKDFDELARYLDRNSYFTEKEQRYRVYLQEVEDERKSIQKEVQLLRKKQYSDKQHEERVWNAMKTVEALENKLETQMIQFGTICTKNIKLRDEINHLLRHRRIFMVQWTKLIDKLTEGKKIMLDLIEQATIAYNQREEWCTKLQILRTQAYSDLHNNLQEMREYKRNYDNNSKLKYFFFIKGKKRVMKDLELKEKEKRLKVEENLREKLETYQQLLKDIVGFTKEKNVRIIADSFAEQEEINLSNFKYIIDSIEKAELDSEHLGNLYQEVDERYALHDIRMLQQKKTIENLEFDLDDAVVDANEARSLLKNTENELNELLEGVWTLFTKCKCEKDPLVSLLGDNTKVNIYNVQLYLQILESKVHQLLVGASYQDKVRKTEDTKKLITPEGVPEIYTIDKMVPATPCSLCVEHEMVSDVIDVLQHIWSKTEARQRLRIRLKMPGGKARLHTISHCQLPKARNIMQRRYE